MQDIKDIINKNITYSKLKNQFISFKKAQGLAKRTLKDYNRTFTIFERYYTKDIIDLEEMKTSLLEMFENFSSGAPATFNVPFSNLMCFFNWCVKNEYIKANPLKQTGLVKKKDLGKARAIPEDIIFKLFDVMNINTFVGLRDYAILTLTLDTGIRPSEAFGIEIEDLDLEHWEVTIKATVSKTRVQRILPLSYQTVEILKRFLMIREEHWINYLFLTINGTQMRTNTWELRIQNYRQKLNYKFTPYDLRHSFSILFLKNRW